MRPCAKWRGVRVLLAALALLALPCAAAQPEQVHASLDGSGIAVMWARPGDVAATADDVLQWGTSSELSATVDDVSSALTGPGTTVFTARGLPATPGTLHYRVGSDAGGWSPTYAIEVPTDRWRIAMFADHGTGAAGEFSQLLIPLVAAERPHLVLHGGDLSYADGTAPVWDDWFRLIEPLAATTPYMAAPGNHEHEGYQPVSGPSPQQAPAPESLMDPYQQFRTRFTFPGDELSYSFDAGPVHVLVLNGEDLCATQPVTYNVPWRVSPPCDPGTSDTSVAEGLPNQELLDFARADLAAHQDSPWTFVLVHRPVHSAGSYVGDPILQRHFAPVFEETGVDLVLTGHDHTYQRSFPMRGPEPASSERDAYAKGHAPIYIVSGGGGEGLYTLQDPAPAWTAARNGTYHHLLLDVTADGLRLQAIATEDGAVFDSFTLGDWTPAQAGDAEEGPQSAPASPAGLLLAAVAAAALAMRRRPQGP